MTKGRAVPPSTVVAGQEPFFITLGERPMTPLSKTYPRKSIHTEISPLRCASVEMTKGRAALPERVVAEQVAVFHRPWVGRRPMIPLS
jgi:hypothetical protein